MPAVKAANPRQIFGAEKWMRITAVSPWRGVWLIAHAWAIVALAAFGAADLLQQRQVVAGVGVGGDRRAFGPVRKHPFLQPADLAGLKVGAQQLAGEAAIDDLRLGGEQVPHAQQGCNGLGDEALGGRGDQQGVALTGELDGRLKLLPLTNGRNLLDEQFLAASRQQVSPLGFDAGILIRFPEVAGDPCKPPAPPPRMITELTPPITREFHANPLPDETSLRRNLP